MERVRNQIHLIAPRSMPVLIEGETGTGKQLAAELIYRLSSRCNAPFVSINCASIPDALLIAELVGHAKGAFTGATAKRIGRIEAADGGTLLLDAVDELSSDVQRLLLRFLETGEITPVGSSEVHKIDVRVIATAEDLPRAVSSGAIRSDLYYRLATFLIRIPPLRERKEDIPILAESFVSQIARRAGVQRPSLSPNTIKRLSAYSFPGNVRELQHILERAVILSSGTSVDDEIKKALGSGDEKRQRPKASEAGRPGDLREKVETLTRELEGLRAMSIRAQPIWQGRSFPTWHDYCFVLMPFGTEFQLQSVYRDHVKPVVERCGLRCQRADDIYDISGVMQSVWEGINRARLIVADLTGKNPNVFYELGIAHTLGKPVVMITQSIDHVPFDLRHLRCCVYEYTPPGAQKLEHRLEKTIKNILSNSADLIP